jgi:hypothetical protein
MSDGEICPNLHVPLEPHSNEGIIHIKGGIPSWLAVLDSQCHLAKNLNTISLPWW